MEFVLLEVIVAFLMFLIFGSIFSQLIGGCLMVVIVFTITALLFIFFSINFVWFVVAGCVICLLGFVQKFIKWNRLPDINQYMVLYSHTRKSMGVSCCHCGSSDLVHHGLFYKTSKYRFYNCSSCGSILYKFKVL